MYVKFVVIMKYVLRTLYKRDVDHGDNCSTNLRLDQDIVKIFETYLRLKNFWKNMLSKIGAIGEKVLALAQAKKGRFIMNFFSNLPTCLEQVSYSPQQSVAMNVWKKV